MNLVINSIGENLRKQKPTGWRRFSFPSCENMTPTAKSKVFISKTKGLEGFAWIKSGAVMKETFKDWKALLTSTP